MSYFKLAVAVTATVLAGVGIWVACREKAPVMGGQSAPVSKSAIPAKVATASDRETLKGVSVTRQPVVTDAVYGLYCRITKALADGTVNQEGVTPAVIVQSMESNDGRGILLDTLLYAPETVIAEELVEVNPSATAVFVSDRGYQGNSILIVGYRDLLFTLMMKDDTHFVAAGPLLDSVSTMGYLQLILESMVEQWKI